MMISLFFILTTIGFLIAAYAFHIDKKIEADATYKPACDISEYVSCSKTVQSPYAKSFGINNSILGMGYYLLLALLVWLGYMQAAFYLSLVGVIASVVFAYILFVKVRALCPLCVSLYVINFLLFALLYVQ